MGVTRRPGLRRRWTRRALSLCVVYAVAAEPVSAQDPGTVVGAVAGWASTNQRWKPAESTDWDGGFILGGFGDAATAVSWLGVRGELTYTQRGGDVLLTVDGQPVRASLRMGYLTLVVHAKLRRGIGPVEAHIAFGPTFDQVLRRELDSLLSQIFEEETPTVFSVAVGAGVGWWVTERVRLALDVRLTEGVSSAHEGNFISVRNRSVEGLFRVAVPVSAFRDR